MTDLHSSGHRDGAVQPDISWASTVPGDELVFEPRRLVSLIHRIEEPLYVVSDRTTRRYGVATGGRLATGDARASGRYRVMSVLPAARPAFLGDKTFCDTHHVRAPYIAGEMANGIATTRLVVSMAKAGLLGFFGAAGLDPDDVGRAVKELTSAIPGHENWGVNLIHSPNEPRLEDRIADLLLAHRVPRISMSAFTDITPAVVRCAATGLHTGRSGLTQRRTQIFAKISHPSVAQRFMAPAPPEILRSLVEQGHLTRDEALLAERVPIAEDVTVEGDSGGHTDNRPLLALLPVITALRDDTVARFRHDRHIRVGAAGGLGCPAGVAAAFALGAAYVVTGSINQVCVEAGISEDAKELLSQADLSDVVMAPAADMFEFGVRVQVLRRGTMFAARAGRLYEAYQKYPSLDAIPEQVRRALEKSVLHESLADIWAETVAFWRRRDPAEIDRAMADPKHRMALVFRWYLGKSSRWAILGERVRRSDYQLWCGPAMGCFNRWSAGSLLAEPENRSVVQIALNLMTGAAVLTRAQQLRSFGVPLPAEAFTYLPRLLSEYRAA